jgi:hypothetical protein
VTRLRALTAAFVIAVLAGCSGGNPGDLTRDAADVLQPAVQHVREVADTGNFAELRAAVANLKDLVHQQERAGNVTPSRAAAILDAADALLTDARDVMSPSPTPTPTLTSESPTPTPTTESPTPVPTTESPSPTPTPTTTSPVATTSVGIGGGGGGGGGDGGNGQGGQP